MELFRQLQTGPGLKLCPRNQSRMSDAISALALYLHFAVENQVQHFSRCPWPDKKRQNPMLSLSSKRLKSLDEKQSGTIFRVFCFLAEEFSQFRA
jgi:hypothetical protein